MKSSYKIILLYDIARFTLPKLSGRIAKCFSFFNLAFCYILFKFSLLTVKSTWTTDTADLEN